MAVKIRLKRMGKIRTPYYRVVVVDSRKKRDGKVIEQIGKYHPKEEPSLIEVTSDRAQYWLGVGAQPSEAVEALLKVTGDWQKFKGLPGTEGTLQGQGAQARQGRDLQRGAQGGRQRPAGRGHHQEERREEGRRSPPRTSRPRPPRSRRGRAGRGEARRGEARRGREAEPTADADKPAEA